MNALSPLELANEIPVQIVKCFKSDPRLCTCRKSKPSIVRAPTGHKSTRKFEGRSSPRKFELDLQNGVYYCPVRLGPQTIGSFGVCGRIISQRTLEAIATLIATAIDRAQAIELVEKPRQRARMSG